jgi:hypothetical protein
VTATGAATITLSVTYNGSATLPAGVSFTDNGGGNGTLTLNSVNTVAGTYTLVLKAQNSVGTNTQIYTFTVASPYAPTGVAAKTDLNNANSVTVSWTAPASGVVTSYTILPTDASTGVAGTLITGVTSTSYDIGPSDYGSGAGLIGGDTYDFVVSAIFGTSGEQSSATSNYTLPTTVTPSSTASSTVSNSQAGTSTASLGTSGSTGSISATAYGQGTVSVAVYNDNPAAGVFSVASGTASYDVSISTGSQFSSVSFQVCGVGSDGVVEWYDSLNGQSYDVSPAPVAVSGSSGCYLVSLSSTSVPSVSDSSLYGSLFYVPSSTGTGTGTGSGGGGSSSSVTPAVPAPTGVSAVGGNSSATVTWNDPTGSNSAVTGYIITSSPGGVTCTVTSATATSCVVSGLTNGTAYTFTITSTGTGGSSTADGPTNAVTPAVPAPTGVSAVAGDSSANVTWVDPANAASNVTGYTVISSPDGASCTVTKATVTSCVISGLTNGTAYTFTVISTSVDGPSIADGPSNTVTPTPSTVSVPTVSAPTGVKVAGGNGLATVTWVDPANATSDVTGYTVISSPGGASCTVTSATATSCVVKGLTNGKSYTFKVSVLIDGAAEAVSARSVAAVPKQLLTLALSPFAKGSSNLTKAMTIQLAKLAAKIVIAKSPRSTVTGLSNGVGTTVVSRAIARARARNAIWDLRLQLKARGYTKPINFGIKNVITTTNNSNATVRRIVVVIT